VPDVELLRAPGCRTAHYLVVENLGRKQQLVKEKTHRFDMERFNLKGSKYLGMTLDAKLSGESILRKKMMSSTSSSGKCIGCLDAILSCQSKINSYYTSKLYVQFGVMVSSSGTAQVIQR
jgi:hypothetical protein